MLYNLIKDKVLVEILFLNRSSSRSIFFKVDTSFGSGGEILKSFPDSNGIGTDLTLLPNNKFLFSGIKGKAIVTLKYNSNDILDSTLATQWEFEYAESGILIKSIDSKNNS